MDYQSFAHRKNSYVRVEEGFGAVLVYIEKAPRALLAAYAANGKGPRSV